MRSNLLGLRTVIYKVGDLAAATKWYETALGVAPYFNEPFYVGFNVAGYELGLQPSDEKNAGTDNVVAYWGVSDIRSSFTRLLAEGATAHEEPTDVGGNIMVASVKDPWGNIFGIIYNPGFSPEGPPVH